jgi:hypothetical protein
MLQSPADVPLFADGFYTHWSNRPSATSFWWKFPMKASQLTDRRFKTRARIRTAPRQLPRAAARHRHPRPLRPRLGGSVISRLSDLGSHSTAFPLPFRGRPLLRRNPSRFRAAYNVDRLALTPYCPSIASPSSSIVASGFF